MDNWDCPAIGLDSLVYKRVHFEELIMICVKNKVSVEIRIEIELMWTFKKKIMCTYYDN